MGNTFVPELPTAAARPRGSRASAPPPAPPRPAGGRYVLGELLGRGGMAEVFAGHALGSLGFQKPVAIKRLLPERARDEEFVARLVAEAKLLVGLQHTNLISVLDLVREGEDVFLVMEYVDGPSLRQLLNGHRQRARGPLPLGLATYIVQAACAGLEFAHARKSGAIVHADVSPSNVLLTAAGEVKVADFGIARREGIAAGVEGKWAYMAPEQARGEALTPRSDQFALGVVLYELITGVHPFARRVSEHGRDEGAVDDVRPPRALRPELPPALEAACLRAMAPDPAARHPRLQHLHDALAELRFACGWREGAPELAEAIARAGASVGAEAADAGKGAPLGSQVTSRPLTIVTRSLLELTPAAASGTASGTASGRPRPRAESTTPHAWSTATAHPPRAPRWQRGALVLSAAAALGAVAPRPSCCARARRPTPRATAGCARARAGEPVAVAPLTVGRRRAEPCQGRQGMGR
ncbi:MAG: serine/threonine protein kinase [Kofleriaceae bacterium]|nr:serine/threonine protein kinase [Kofleriaceae bacterium]